MKFELSNHASHQQPDWDGIGILPTGYGKYISQLIINYKIINFPRGFTK